MAGQNLKQKDLGVRRLWRPALLLVSISISSAFAQAQPGTNAPNPGAEVVSPNSPWAQVIVVGASASAGFTQSEMLGGPNTPHYSLSRYLNAALAGPHRPVRNLANTFFFANAESEGRKQIDLALKAKPTLLVGVDFLFWFCYGQMGTNQDRAARFEKGLKMLEPVQCPLVLGDIPDASTAVNGMLTPAEIPSLKTMAEANRRLKEWASKRPQTIIVPLASFMRTVLSDEAITIRDQTIPRGKTRPFLQADQLHPTPRGAAVLAVLILDAFQTTCPSVNAADIRWNPREVFTLGSNRSQPSSKPAGETNLPATTEK